MLLFISMLQHLVRYCCHSPPTLAEQEAIAEALSDADAWIMGLEAELAKKRNLKAGMLHDLLTARTRLPGFSGDWEVKTLRELSSIYRGASPRPIDSPVWFDENSNIGWVRISDVSKANKYLFQTEQKLSKEGIQKNRFVPKDNLIMSICATVGKPILNKIDVCIHDGFVVFERSSAIIGYMYYVLQKLENEWSKHGQTGSQMNLNTGIINKASVLFPPTPEEQTAIAAALSDMDADIEATQAKLTKARAIKAGMMDNLLTGKVRLIDSVVMTRAHNRKVKYAFNSTQTQ